MDNQCCCGMSLEEKKEYEKLEKGHLKCLEDSLAKGDQKGAAISYNNLGDLYLNQHEPGKAEPMYNKALEINQKVNDKEKMARNYFGLGNVYLDQMNFDKAEDAFLKAGAIYKETGDEHSLRAIFFNLGSAYFCRGNLDKAEEMYLKSIDENEKTRNPSFYLTLSRVYKEKNDKEKEKCCLKKAVDILENNGPKELMEKIQKRIDEL